MDDLETDYSFLFESLSTRARPAKKLKPNTRFLQHIVREANSHNAALLAKETAEARTRLRQLSRRSRAGDESSDDNASHRHSGHSRKHRDDRTRDVGRKDDRTRRRKRHHDSEQVWSSRADREGDERHRRPSRHADEDEDEGGKHEEGKMRLKSPRHHRSRHSHRSRRDSRSRSPDNSNSDADADKGHRHERRERGEHSDRRKRNNRSRSPRERDIRQDRQRRHRERSPLSVTKKDSRDGASSHRLSRRSPHRHGKDSIAAAPDSSSDSDPLSEFVGPLPASGPGSAAATVRVRGRGALAGTSSMDRHFSADYDPSQDVELPESTAGGGGPTVDDARAEMQRDRQKLLREGAARLKTAGFTDREIAIWTRGGKRDVADIQWTKKGEAREWDRGKVAGDNGPAKPEWAR